MSKRRGAQDPEPRAKPYKGVDSYQPEDADLFFGRDHEAARLLATVQGSRFTLLHARSGAGKTSLLNARIIPHLEARGTTPVRILLYDDPIESVRISTLLQVLPPPQAEVAAIQRALAELPRNEKTGEDDPDPTFAQLLDRFDSLAVDSLRRRSLVAPVKLQAGLLGSDNPGAASCTPYFCRILRMSLDIITFSDHLAALTDEALIFEEDNSGEILRVDEGTRMSELLEILGSEALAADYHNLVDWLYFLPDPGLRTFFENLVEDYGQMRSSFSLTLIFDQFEELFTRFIDPGPALGNRDPKIRPWQKRRDFIRELKNLYWTDHGSCTRSDGASPAPEILPIRYVISIRDEYIAQLSRIRSFVPELEKSTLQLGFLRRQNAEEAILKPAERFGFDYTEDCYGEIIEKLTREEHYIEPAHIQIVCERLWRELRRRREKDPQSLGSNQIDASFFQRLGGPEKILESFFDEVLGDLTPKQRERALEMLGLLITSSGTRNIVAEEELVKGHTRQRRYRLDLLKKLDQKQIIRVERRLEGRFAEITHEFMIQPIQRAISKDLGRYERYAGYQFRDFLYELPDDGQRLEVLEMLEQLISARGNRISKTLKKLLYEDFRQAETRRKLLKRLEKSFIIERYQRGKRGKETFIRIYHDFLVVPIQDEIRRRIAGDDEYRRFRDALPRLRAAKSGDFRTAASGLVPAETLALLEAHLERLDWGYQGTELMFRSALLKGERSDTLRGWAERLRQGEDTWSAEKLLADEHREAESRPFALDELAEINAARDRLDLEPRQIALIFRSELLMAGEAQRDDVFYWAGRMVDHGA